MEICGPTPRSEAFQSESALAQRRAHVAGVRSLQEETAEVLRLGSPFTIIEISHWPPPSSLEEFRAASRAAPTHLSDKSIVVRDVEGRRIAWALHGRARRVGLSRILPRLRPRAERGHNGPHHTGENIMARYLLLKHYRRTSGPDDLVVAGADWSAAGVPMDQWTPEEIDAHMKYMSDFAAKLEESGEFVDAQALSQEGTFVRYDGQGRPPVTDGPFA